MAKYARLTLERRQEIENMFQGFTPTLCYGSDYAPRQAGAVT
ncbi:MAG: hypothetical protein Q8P61_04065 [Candidatus Nanopelagicales bacterium]|nr:hypothetical protein [Candidatus Nanopelagicales bacterium]